MTGRSGLAAKGGCFAGSGWLRLVLAASVAAMALSVATDAAEARLLRRTPDKRQALKKDPPAPAVKGQLIIAISIGSQRLTVYDDGVPIAHSPVSSGTAGHPTPTGVFSIIQKNRHHRSNIYSGAPMPFMQRITWSGVALHAGVLPGYPASHGCIRLPHDFAARLWGMTKLGARVVVTRHDVTPVTISHARLTALQTPVMATAEDKRADLLRPSIGIDEPAAPTVAAAIRTADASAGAVASDASAPTGSALPAAAAEVVVTPVAAPAAGEPDAAAPSSSPAMQASDQAVSPTPTPTGEVAETASGPAATGSAVEEPSDKPSPPATTVTVTPPQLPPARDETEKTAIAPAEATPAPETTSAIDLALPSAVPTAAAPVSTAAPVGAVVTPPAADVVVAPPSPDAASLAALPLDEVFVPPARPARPLRTGPVSVFISRKDARLYVRKRFDPLFSLPIAIKSDQPIGTHVYTAAEGEVGAGLRWIAVSLPAELPKAAKPGPKHDRRLGAKADPARAKAVAAPAVLPSPSTAAEALDRVDLPAEVVAQIAGLVSLGASIVISDHGLGYETGLETDFIVLSR